MTTCKCGATWSGKRLEHCTVCHETFTGTSAGDKHRTGTYWPDERRCLSVDEMAAKGMTRNRNGHWTTGGDGSAWWGESGRSVVPESDEQPSGAVGGAGEGSDAAEGDQALRDGLRGWGA